MKKLRSLPFWMCVTCNQLDFSVVVDKKEKKKGRDTKTIDYPLCSSLVDLL